MIGKCIKNSFYSFRMILAVLGILFLGLLIGGGIVIKGTNNIMSDMAKQIKSTTNDISVDSDLLWGETIKAIRNETAASSMNLNIMISAIDDNGDKFISINELQDCVVDALSNVVSDNVKGFENSIPELSEIITNSYRNFCKLLFAFGLIFIISAVISRIFVVTLSKTDDEHPNPVRQMAVRSIHDVCIIAIIILLGALVVLMPKVGIIALIIYPLLYCLASLVFAQFTLKRKDRASITMVFGGMNVFILVLGNYAELIIAAIITFLIAKYFSAVVAIYLLVALVIVIFAATTLSAETIALQMEIKHNSQIGEDPDFVDLDEEEYDE